MLVWIAVGVIAVVFVIWRLYLWTKDNPRNQYILAGAIGILLIFAVIIKNIPGLDEGWNRLQDFLAPFAFLVILMSGVVFFVRKKETIPRIVVFFIALIVLGITFSLGYGGNP